MQDIQLYQQILGDTQPWRVERVSLKRDELTIEIEMALSETTWDCKQRMHVHGYERRRWRHLDSCQFKTILSADVPRVQCDEHGTQTVQVPWAEKHGRFTAMFERLAIDVMTECSIQAAHQMLRISWEEADGIKQRAVRRGLARRTAQPIKRLCVDEKASGRGHRYVTVVTVADGASPRVLYVGEDRTRESMDLFWETLTPDQRAGVEAVSMDMWKPYRDSTMTHAPQADIIHDAFHLARYLNRAVDQVRREEQRRLWRREDGVLKGTRQLWLYGYENVPHKWAHRFKELCRSTLKTARAWELKELWRTYGNCADPDDARAFFKRWYRKVMKSGLAARHRRWPDLAGRDDPAGRRRPRKGASGPDRDLLQTPFQQLHCRSD